ncbi:N-acetyltransferase [Halopseudomonas oceani]|uniref:GNAT family N-acetyltransferase n=1 Tax=Halopseudomonas oceani TaxID=1708783 RepID=A0A2P4EVL9_9GAMM|nr:GNAT family N-acetyltransferase [Halopseudomonas oceani]POB03626.1 GNAT family N-acetyltransferase [Halopseudomonas oceani]GGE45078.1 N-acetyltransferase [Halopseudomonas oceani]
MPGDDPPRQPLITRLPAEQLPLVNRLYRQYQRGMKARGDQHVWVARNPQITASLCLQPIEQCWWLTGLLVAPGERGKRLASQLLQTVRAHYQNDIWLFCNPALAPLYSLNGFQPSDMAPAPLRDRLARYQRSKSLIAMVNPGR